MVGAWRAAGAAAAGVIAAIGLSGAAAAQPSFDCRSAGRPAEQAICDSPSLSALDRELDAVYGRLVSSLPGYQRQQIRDEQRDWLRRRNGCGYDADCLGAVYRYRIDQLARY